MDNYTFILEHGPEDAGKMLCRLMDQSEKYLDKDITCCDICPVNENCCRDHNGFVEWLKSKHE